MQNPKAKSGETGRYDEATRQSVEQSEQRAAEPIEQQAHHAKDEALAQISRLANMSEISEDDVKILFERYDPNHDRKWERDDARLFLMDLQESFGKPRVIPDEALDPVISQLQLDTTSISGVTWVDFRSYLLHLQEYPLRQLSNFVSRLFDAEHASHAVIVTNISKTTDRKALVVAFVAAGPLVDVFYVNPGVVGTGLVTFAPQALIIYEQKSSVTEALRLNNTYLDSSRIVVVPFENQEFPLLLRAERNPSAIATGLAQGIIMGKQAAAKITAIDNQLGISNVVRGTGHRIASLASDIDEKLHISETARQLDDRYQISDTVVAMKNKTVNLAHSVDNQLGISEKAAAVLHSGPVQTVTAPFTKFRDDTQSVIDQNKDKFEQPEAMPSGSTAAASSSSSSMSSQQQPSQGSAFSSSSSSSSEHQQQAQGSSSWLPSAETVKSWIPSSLKGNASEQQHQQQASSSESKPFLQSDASQLKGEQRSSAFSSSSSSSTIPRDKQ